MSQLIFTTTLGANHYYYLYLHVRIVRFRKVKSVTPIHTTGEKWSLIQSSVASPREAKRVILSSGASPDVVTLLVDD